jgi:colanic acid/amylovoran biosynthesis glycosyltransferase
MTLLVATQNYNATAETYVRQHMTGIAPGRTVGLGLAHKGAPPTDLPFLSIRPPESRFLRKAYLMHGRMAHGFPGSPVGRNREKLRRFIRDHEVTLIFAEFGPTGAALRTLAKDENIPLVVNFHGFDATVMPRRPEIRATYALLARDASGFVCGSRHFKTVVAGVGMPEDRIRVVPCGIDSGRFRTPGEKTGKRLISVGRLTEKKAPLRTLEAFAAAKPSVPGLTLDMIGGGPLASDCEAFLRENGLREDVTLHGALEHDRVIEMLSEADIFVQHSVTAPNGDTESQGISLVEAMAAGLPVITTDHNGFSETVVAGETGFLVAEHDSKAMAEMIVALASDPERARTLGQAGRHRALTYFDQAVTNRALRAYLNEFAEL